MDPNAAVQQRKDKEREEAFESAISKAIQERSRFVVKLILFAHVTCCMKLHVA